MLLMAVFIIIVTSFIIVGIVSGDYGFTRGMASAVSDSDAGVAHLVQQFVPPAMDFVVAVASTALLPLMLGVNTTIQSSFDLPATANALVCINTTLWQLPNVTQTQLLLNQLLLSTAALQGDVSLLTADLANVSFLRSGVAFNAAALEFDVNAFNLPQLSSAISNASALVASTQHLKDSTVGPGGVVAASISDLQALPRIDARPTPGLFPSVVNFTDASGDGTGDTVGTVFGLSSTPLNVAVTNTPLLISRLSGLQSAVAAMPNYTLTANALLNASAIIDAATASPSLATRLNATIALLQTLVHGLPTSASVLPVAATLYQNATAVVPMMSTLILHLSQLQLDLNVSEYCPLNRKLLPCS